MTTDEILAAMDKRAKAHRELQPAGFMIGSSPDVLAMNIQATIWETALMQAQLLVALHREEKTQ